MILTTSYAMCAVNVQFKFHWCTKCKYLIRGCTHMTLLMPPTETVPYSTHNIADITVNQEALKWKNMILINIKNIL